MYLDERDRKYHEGPLHGQFVGSTDEIRDPKSWEWLKSGRLKTETEGFLMAVQDQALRKNNAVNIIDKQNTSPTSRLCGERAETVGNHMISSAIWDKSARVNFSKTTRKSCDYLLIIHILQHFTL